MVCSTTWRILLTLLYAFSTSSISSPLGRFLCGVIIPLSHVSLAGDPPGGVDPLEQSGGARGGRVVHGPRGPARILRRAGPGSERSCPLARTHRDADRGGCIGSSRGRGRRPPRKSQPSGTSSAVSSSPFRIRAIASVRALTARETVGQHAWELSDRSLHNVIAQVDQSRPRPPGQAQDRRTPLDTLSRAAGRAARRTRHRSIPWYTP